MTNRSIEIANSLMRQMIEEEIAAGKSIQIRVKGVSMMPLLNDNRDIVELFPPKKDEPTVGQIVLFKNGDSFLLHRLIRREGEELLMMGDGSLVAQEKIRLNDVIGIVNYVITPDGRKIPTDSSGWRLKSRLWLFLTPIRKHLLRVIRLYNRFRGRA